MREELFRPEVIEHQRERLIGTVILSHPISRLMWLSVIAIFALLVIALLIFGSYTRKEKIQGYIVPSKGLVEVYSDRAGTIVKTLVESGDLVAADDPLLEISNERAVHGGEKVNVGLIDSLKLQQDILRSQIERLKSNKNEKQAHLEKRRDNLLAQVKQINVQIKFQEEHVNLLVARYEAVKTLGRNKYISDDELQRRQELCLVEQKSLESMKNTLIQLRASQNDNEIDMTLLDDQTQSQIDDLQSRVSSLEQSILQRKGEYGFEVTAPISGRVASLQSYSGQRVTPNKPIMAIIPENTDLEAELFIPTRAIGFIQKGLGVEIRYDSFPYEKFGVYRGKVDMVSKSIFTPDQITAPLAINEPVYRTRVKLNQNKIYAFAQEYPLQVGMKLEASILLENRPLYQWLFKPIYGLRESL